MNLMTLCMNSTTTKNRRCDFVYKTSHLVILQGLTCILNVINFLAPCMKSIILFPSVSLVIRRGCAFASAVMQDTSPRASTRCQPTSGGILS